MDIDTSIAFNLFISRIGNLDNLQKDKFFKYYKNLLFEIAKSKNNK